MEEGGECKTTLKTIDINGVQEEREISIFQNGWWTLELELGDTVCWVG